MISLKKKVLFILAAILVLALVYAYDTMRHDPNFILKHASSELELDTSREVTYQYDQMFSSSRTKAPVFFFKPAESGSYTFTVSDIDADKNDAVLVINVMDRNMSDYMQFEAAVDAEGMVTDIEKVNEGDPGSISGSVLLTRNKPYFVTFDVSPEGEDIDKFKGSFKITVTKTPEEEEEPELTTEAPVMVTVNKNEQAAVLFRPEEDGYYRFDTELITSAGGSSALASVISSDGITIKDFDGICYLPSDTDYHVRVSVDEIKGKKADVAVSCSRLATYTSDALSEVEINGEALIELKTEESYTLVIYSVSDGDTRGEIVDSEGYPVGNDDNSGSELSGREEDYAIVLNVEKGKKYYLYTGGKFNECTVKFALYTGDGTTLTADDIIPVREKAEADQAEEGETEHEGSDPEDNAEKGETESDSGDASAGE